MMVFSIIEFENGKVGFHVATELFKRHILTAGTEINATTIRIEPTSLILDESIDKLLVNLDEVLADMLSVSVK